jgi:hypothetical protein
MPALNYNQRKKKHKSLNACPKLNNLEEQKYFFHQKAKEKSKSEIPSLLHAPLWSKSYWTGPKLRCMEGERNPTFFKS